MSLCYALVAIRTVVTLGQWTTHKRPGCNSDDCSNLDGCFQKFGIQSQYCRKCTGVLGWVMSVNNLFPYTL